MNSFQRLESAMTMIDMGQLRAEYRSLLAIKSWAIEQLGVDYRAGDRVAICSEIPKKGVWRNYETHLSVGATGLAREIHYNMFAVAEGEAPWQTLFIPDGVKTLFALPPTSLTKL